MLQWHGPDEEPGFFQLLNDITDLIHDGSDVLLKNILADIYPADIALIINSLEEAEAIELFRMLPGKDASEVLVEMGESQRNVILQNLPSEEIISLVGEMDSNDATDIISVLSDEVAEYVLEKMKFEDSSEVKELLSYEESTAGGIMQKEFVVIAATDTIAQAILRIRSEARDNEHLYHVWVTDSEKKLVGTVSLKNLIMAIDTPSMIIAISRGGAVR